MATRLSYVCIICSSVGARSHSILEKSFYLCERHNSMVGSNDAQLISDAQDAWQRLTKADNDKTIWRRNELYDLIKTVKLIETNG